VSHWSTLIEDFQASPLAFYQAVEEALTRRQVPQTQNSRVDHREGGLLSANREYLHITRDKLVFDICGAPFGTGFFVSWWLAEDAFRLNALQKVGAIFGMLLVWVAFWNMLGLILGSLILIVIVFGGLALASTVANAGDHDDLFLRELPIIGSLYVRLFKTETYYRIDTMLMFQQAVHNAVLEVIDAMTADKGVRALSETERRPIMKEFYSRKGA